MSEYEYQHFRRKINWFTNGALFKSFYIILICFNLQLASTADVCSSPQCKKTAETIIYNMLPNADPCKDFFEFACGGFEQKVSVDENEIDSTFPDDLLNLIDEQIESLFNRSTQPSSAFQKAHEFYSSCMDEKTIEKRGLGELKAQVKRIGGWPVIDSKWDEKKFDLTKTKIKIQREGLYSHILFGFDVVVDDDAKKFSLLVYQGGLGLKKYFLLQGMEDPVVKTYLEIMVDLAVEFGAPSKKQAQQDMSKAVEFEIAVANILINLTSEDYSHITIEQLERNLPFVSWYKYLSKGLKGATSISPKQGIIVREDYLVQLSQLIKKTPTRTLANYMVSQAVWGKAYYLTKKLQSLYLKLDVVMYNITSLPPRRDVCLQELKDRFEQVVSAGYVQKYFDQEKKSKVEQMVSQLQAELLNVLEAESWMSKYSLKDSKEKVNKLNYIIGAPDELYDNNVLDDFYKNLKTDPGEFYGNVVATDIFTRNFDYSFLHKVVNKTVWYDHSFSTLLNVVYLEKYQVMDITAAITNDIFYSSERPDYLNYGLLGFIIASHQMELFDNEGYQLDEYGNQRAVWDNITINKFYEREDKLANAYQKYYTDPEFNETFSDPDTIDSITSDQAGLKIAYQTFQKVAASKKQPRLIHLEQFSPGQLFWLWFANGFCYKISPTATEESIPFGDNLITKFMINGPLWNSPKFSFDWNCTLNSNMNPKTKVNVW